MHIMLKLLMVAVLMTSTGTVSAAEAKGGEGITPVGDGKRFGIFNVVDLGATGDGLTLETAAIQRAIDSAAAAGGGTVLVPPGKYVTGSLRLKSYVTLQIEAGAVLLGSTDLDDYPVNIPAFRSYTDNYVKQSLIYAEDAHHVAIVGNGTIDGQGAAFTDRSYLVRPYLIRLVSCTNVLLENVNLKDSPMWATHLLACDFVRVSGISVISQVNQNNDMLDIDCCTDVRVSDCYADTGDDAIVLKSTADRITERVTISNCVLKSNCNAIKMGTESNGGFRNVTISNCSIDSDYPVKGYYGRNRGITGVSLEMVDGGILENISISNLTMEGVNVPIFLRLGNRARPFKADMKKPGMGMFRNVIISNIIATGVGKIGCSITGLPGHPIENVTLSNIRITYPGGGTAADARKPTPEKPDAYPEATMFGTLPAYGFYCRHVTGLRFSHVDLNLEGDDYRPAIVCEDVHGLEIEDVVADRSSIGGEPMLRFRDVTEATIRSCTPPDGAPVFLRLEGEARRISSVGNDFAGVTEPFQIGPGVSPTVLFRTGDRPPE
ncbi:glycoside hydrolase family 28 protein [candidate division KSB1 bacterium]